MKNEIPEKHSRVLFDPISKNFLAALFAVITSDKAGKSDIIHQVMSPNTFHELELTHGQVSMLRHTKIQPW